MSPDSAVPFSDIGSPAATQPAAPGAPAVGPTSHGPASVAGVVTVALLRYTGDGHHRTTTMSVNAPGVFPEPGGVWYLASSQQPGTTALYGCQRGQNNFVSTKAGCEGATVLRVEGFIYTAKPAAPSLELFRCSIPSIGDSYVSGSRDCEKAGGSTNDGTLGFVLTTSKVALSRFVNGIDHWVTTGPITSGYRSEAIWFLESSAKPGTAPVYGCVRTTSKGTDHFLSLRANCEGNTVLRTEGWAYSNKPASGPYVLLYRCYWTPKEDHFITPHEDCEKADGATKEGPLGYAAAA